MPPTSTWGTPPRSMMAASDSGGSRGHDMGPSTAPWTSNVVAVLPEVARVFTETPTLIHRAVCARQAAAGALQPGHDELERRARPDPHRRRQAGEPRASAAGPRERGLRRRGRRERPELPEPG